MAFTLATLRTAISDFVQSTETTFQATRDTFILQTEDIISKAVILPANRKNGTVTFTSGATTANLPSDFLAPFELRCVSGDTYTPILYADVSLMRECYPDPNYVGVPRWYSMYSDSTIILSPTPTTSLSGWLNYFYKPASLTAGADGGTTWLSTNAENCLLYGCLVQAYTFLKGEPDILKDYNDKFQAALNDLRKLGEGMDLGDAYRMGEKRLMPVSP